MSAPAPWPRPGCAAHLLGFRTPGQRIFPRSRRRWLIAFALTTWLYRLVVFLGIAVLVYLFFFKVLGLFLMVVELYLVHRQAGDEGTGVWHERKREIRWSRRVAAGCCWCWWGCCCFCR
jgi:putative peptide zinc metalloprotease protein